MGGADPQGGQRAALGLDVLGGVQKTDEVERYPDLEREFGVVEDWIAGGKPLLGVCPGAQMIAHVSGGSVFEASERDFGWLENEQLEVGRLKLTTDFVIAPAIGRAVSHSRSPEQAE